MTENDYISKRLNDQIDWYSNKSQWNQKWFKRLRILEITLAAAIPVLSINLNNSAIIKYITASISAGITIIISIQSLYNFHEYWIEYRMVAETLKHEKYLYETTTGIYNSGQTTKLNLLIERVESIISHENINWSQMNKLSNNKHKN